MNKILSNKLAKAHTYRLKLLAFNLRQIARRKSRGSRIIFVNCQFLFNFHHRNIAKMESHKRFFQVIVVIFGIYNISKVVEPAMSFHASIERFSFLECVFKNFNVAVAVVCSILLAVGAITSRLKFLKYGLGLLVFQIVVILFMTEKIYELTRRCEETFGKKYSAEQASFVFCSFVFSFGKNSFQFFQQIVVNNYPKQCLQSSQLSQRGS